MSDALPAQTRRRDVVAAILFFTVVNIGLVAMNGVRHGGDTRLYLDGASRLLAGEPLIDREPSYVGYVGMVAAAQAVGSGTTGVVILQVALGAAAAGVVYLIGTTLAGRVAGAVAAALYSVDVDTNRWHQFILADSAYLSLFTIGVWLAHRAATRQGTEPLMSALGVLVGAGLVRPEGWFVIPAGLCYIMVLRARSAAQRVAGVGALVTAAVLLALALAPSFSGNLQAIGPADMLRRGQTIWDFEGWRVAMPSSDANPDRAGGAIEYALRHPASTIKLMLARSAVHFAHVRPFYSALHNFAIVVWLAPVYAATLFAVWKLRPSPLVLWILAAIGTQTLVVALTHADWDGRYLSHVLPLIDTLVGAGVAIAFGESAVPGAAPAHV